MSSAAKIGDTFFRYLDFGMIVPGYKTVELSGLLLVEAGILPMLVDSEPEPILVSLSPAGRKELFWLDN